MFGMGAARGPALGKIRPRVISGVEKMGLPWDAYYILTKAHAGFPNSKIHPNSGAPDYNIRHDHTLDFTNVGSNTHAQIDTHLANTSNPHAVTLGQAFDAEAGTRTLELDTAADLLDHQLTFQSSGGNPAVKWSKAGGASFIRFRAASDDFIEWRMEGFAVQNTFFDNTTSSEFWIDSTYGHTGPTGDWGIGSDKSLTFDLGAGESIYPQTDNQIDFGETTLRWKDIWLSGNLRDDTDSISVTNLKTSLDHVSADGSSHSKVTANETAIALNTTHRSSDGSDHSLIDQSVVSGATPTFTATNITGVPAASILAGTFGAGNYTVDGDFAVASANGRIWGISGLAPGHTVHFQYGGDSFNRMSITYGSFATITAFHGIKFTNWGAQEICRLGTAFTSVDSYFKGHVAVGNTDTTLAALLVDQKSTSAAIPVLYLDQADVSEEILQIVSTAGVGNAIEAVGAKSLTTTLFVKCTINGATVYLQAGTIA